MENQVEKKKIIVSVDAETDGLWGKPFAVAAKAYDEQGQEISSFCARSNEPVQNEWVKENVLPALQDIEVAGGYIDLLKSFADFYNQMREQYNVTVLWHMGHVVEAYLFRELVNHKLIGEWDAPYTPIEVAEHLRIHGFAPDSVDNYAKQHNLSLPEGSTHNPMYDCIVAYEVYRHINNPSPAKKSIFCR